MGTPSRAAIEYNLFHTDFYEDVLTLPNRFRLNIGCLSERNRREDERRKEEQRSTKADAGRHSYSEHIGEI